MTKHKFTPKIISDEKPIFDSKVAKALSAYGRQTVELERVKEDLYRKLNKERTAFVKAVNAKVRGLLKGLPKYTVYPTYSVSLDYRNSGDVVPVVSVKWYIKGIHTYGSNRNHAIAEARKYWQNNQKKKSCPTTDLQKEIAKLQKLVSSLKKKG